MYFDIDKACKTMSFIHFSYSSRAILKFIEAILTFLVYTISGISWYFKLRCSTGTSRDSSGTYAEVRTDRRQFLRQNVDNLLGSTLFSP